MVDKGHVVVVVEMASVPVVDEVEGMPGGLQAAELRQPDGVAFECDEAAASRSAQVVELPRGAISRPTLKDGTVSRLAGSQ